VGARVSQALEKNPPRLPDALASRAVEIRDDNVVFAARLRRKRVVHRSGL
jgi:hypothetical protein